MSKGQTLRALVNERLAAAAEDIFVLFERTIAEYEEELCRSKEENQRKQQLLDNDPRIELVRRNFQISSTSPGPSLNQEITESPQIKEEPEQQSVKQEEEQLPESVPESSAVKEETQGEDISSEPHFHSETEGQTENSSDTDNDDDWEPPVSCSPAQMETEADGDQDNQDQIRNRSNKLFPQNKSVPETTVHNEDISGADRKKHQCPFCEKRFTTKPILDVHIRVHTGERPFSCSICKRTFTRKEILKNHSRIHTGEKPYSCTVCKKPYATKYALNYHRKTHSGERPFSCSICEKSFVSKHNLHRHRKTHERGTLPLFNMREKLD